MKAGLEWWGNSSFMIGPFPVDVEDVRSGRLRDVAHLEDLRQTHDLDPMFTLRFGDGSTIEVLVDRPDDDGRFGFDSSPEDETGKFTETDDVMLTAAWLTEHGFVNVESTSSTGGNGSRLSAFGVRLDRLLENRRAGPATVAQAANVPASTLEAVLADAQADTALLRRLAPALGLHAADLFVIAGRDLPVDPAPAGGTRPWHVGQVMLSAMRLHGERFDRLHEFIRSVPGRDPVAPLPVPRSPAGPGALVGGLLANRNIRPHIAKLLYTIGDGPIISDSTVYRVIHGAADKTIVDESSTRAAVAGVTAD